MRANGAFKWEFPKIRDFGGPNNKDYSILGSILGYPYFGKLPNRFLRTLPGSWFLARPHPYGGLGFSVGVERGARTHLGGNAGPT